MTCLNNTYTELVAQKTNETDKLQKISAIGLYTDGNKDNSDYDIVGDIDRINGLLFSEDLKYNGVTNNSKSSLASYLAGNAVPALFVEEASTGATNTGNLDTTNLGNLCSTNDTSIPLDSLVDENFMNELDSTLSSDMSVPNDLRYGGDISKNFSSSSTNKTTPTSAGDFFHPGGNCSGMFCIDVRFVSGNMNLLGGGKSTSIEGIIEKHTEILDPISKTQLACQTMRNQMGELSFDKLKLSEILSGLRVYYVTKPQKEKRLKSEATPQSEEEELLQIQRCAYATSGLPTNIEAANGPQVAGYSLNTTSNTENYDNRIITTTPQDTNQYGIGANCMELYMDEGRNTYANTFSTDISEIESFTRSMVQVITNIVNIGTQMDSKPTGCV